jgi:hypothetical protein
MEEWGAGPLREGDGIWDDLLETKWDGKVRIGQAMCSVEEGGAGMISSLSLEFGPVRTTVKGPDGEDVRYGDIGQVIGFKVFDSRGRIAPNGTFSTFVQGRECCHFVGWVRIKYLHCWTNSCVGNQTWLRRMARKGGDYQAPRACHQKT